MSGHTSYLQNPNDPGAFQMMPNMSMQQSHFQSEQPRNTSFYASSHASASSSSLIDQLSDHESSYSSSFEPLGPGNMGHIRSARNGPGPSSSSQGFPCPNCGKVFARDDLLRRHLAREARALAQPSFDRQKSCYECARSKARCDLEVPTCGRCRTRGKQCMYAPRSGNPNVRKARNAGLIPPGASATPMHAMSSGAAAIPTNADYANVMSNQAWGLPGSGYDLTTHPFMTPNPAYAKRDGESDYDSQSESDAQSWHDPSGQNFPVSRSSPGSSASGSAFGSPRSQHSLPEPPESAPPNMSNFSISDPPYTASNVAEPVRTDSPRSFHEFNVDSDAAPAPSRINSRKSSGFSRTNTGSIMTNMDRGVASFANEEGEETPVVRLNQSFNQSGSTLTNGFLAAPQTRQRATSHPETLQNAMPEDATMNDSWNTRTSLNPAFPQPNQRQMQQLSGSASMMPPPRPPALITSNLAGRPTWPAPSPMRSAAFGGNIDLSGWLAEPVVPSPLYRMGPSLNSAITGAFNAFIQSPTTETPISAKFSASLAQSMGLTSNTNADTHLQPPSDNSANSTPHRSYSDPSNSSASRYDCDGQLVLPAPQLPNTKQWWISPDQTGEVAASIAQASAAHFVSYPALMVLTDPTAPIPPFIHRAWLQENRTKVPASLANARSILAGYYVRLPASQNLVWNMISDQIRLILSKQEALCQSDSDPMEVFGSVAALWMYLVLVVFTDEPASTQHINAELLDTCLLALSELSKMLLSHTHAAVKAQTEAPSKDFATFGWIETMIRTLFASYSLLVLQRFRENAGNARERLAGCSLILDLPLPAGAAEFEAGSEQDWLQARDASLDALSKAGSPSSRPSLRQLIQYRSETRASEPDPEQAEAKLRDAPWTTLIFEKQDQFTNVVLSVAFALDDSKV